MEFHVSQKETEWASYWKENNLQFAHELPLKSEDIVALQQWLKEQLQTRWYDSSRLIVRKLWYHYPFTCLLATSTIALDQEDAGFWTLFANFYSLNNNFVNDWKEEMNSALQKNAIYRSVDSHRRYYLTALSHSGVTSIYALENIYHYFISQVIEQRRQLPSAIRQVINGQWQWSDQLKKPILLYIEQSLRNPEPLFRLKEFFMEKRTFSSFPPYMHKNLKTIQQIAQVERKKHSRRQFVFWDEMLNRPRIKLPIIEREKAQRAFWNVGHQTVQCQREATDHSVRFHPLEIEIDYDPNQETLILTIDSEEEVYELPSPYPFYFKQKQSTTDYELLRGNYVEPGTEIVIVKPSNFSTNEAYRPISHPIWREFEYKRFSIHSDTEFYFQSEQGFIRKQFVTTAKIEITLDTQPLFYSKEKHYAEFPTLRFHDLDSFQDLLDWSITLNDSTFGFEYFSDALIQQEEDVLLDLQQLKVHRNLLQSVALHLQNQHKGHTYRLNFVLLPRDFSYRQHQDHVRFSSRHLQKIRLATKTFSPQERSIRIPTDYLKESVPMTFTIAGHPLYTVDFSKVFFEYEILSKNGAGKIFTPEEIGDISIRITRLYPSHEIFHAHLSIHNSKSLENIPISIKRNQYTNVVSLNICHHALKRFESGSITLVINDQSEFICHFTDELHPLLHMDESFTVHLAYQLEYDIKFKIFHPYSLVVKDDVWIIPRGVTHLCLSPFSDHDVVVNGIKNDTDWFASEDDIIAFPKLQTPLSKEHLINFINSLDETNWSDFIHKLNTYGATYVQQLDQIQPLLLKRVLESPELTRLTITTLDSNQVPWENWVNLFGIYLWEAEEQYHFFEKIHGSRLINTAFCHVRTFSQLNVSDRHILRQQFKRFSPEHLHPLDFDIIDSCNPYLDDRFYTDPSEVISHKLHLERELQWADDQLQKWVKANKLPLSVQKLIDEREFPPNVNMNQFPTLFYITLRTKLLALGLSPRLKISAKQKINQKLKQLPISSTKDLSHDSYHLATAWEEHT